MAKNFKDDDYKIIHDDIKKIQARPSMYISSLGDSGVFHLCKEIIDNCRDECYKKESPGNTIRLEITDKELRAMDNGRGIPTDIIQEVYETIQAGSNMTRSSGYTAGENGTGSTCVLALSSMMDVTTRRPTEKKMHRLVYHNGVLKDRIEDNNYTDKAHGLDLTFRPSKKYLGVDTIPIEMLHNWIKDFDYTLPKDITMTYSINKKEYKVEYKPLYTFFDSQIPAGDKRLTDVLEIKCNGNMIETIPDGDFKRSFDIECAIMYCNPETYKGETIQHSWMNHIHTIQNGSHIDGAIRGFSKYITELIVKKNKKLEGEDLKKDIMNHINIVVKANCDVALMFSSQAKHTVFNRSLGKAIEKAVYEELSNFSNTRIINSMVDVVIGNHRARIEGEKARNINSVVKVKKQWTRPDSFFPCSSIKTDYPKEIFLVEGNSAGGGLKLARDAKYQAILTYRGKSMNVWDVDLSDAMKSVPLLNTVKVLGCGIGDAFDINKLVYDKVIIATDADIDGFHIRSIMLTFFFRFMRGLIEAGKVYVAEPPLYQLKYNSNKISYVADHNEYLGKCVDAVSGIKINFPSMKNQSIDNRDFIIEAFEYPNVLGETSIDRLANRYLLEYIAWGIAENGNVETFKKNIDKWLKKLVKVFPELGYNHKNNQIHATIDLVDQIIVIDDALEKSLKFVIDMINKYGIIIEFIDKDGKKQSTTLLRFFEYSQKYFPVIKDRYKGLGSSDPDVSNEIIMNPKTRRMTRITMDNIDTFADLSMLMGKSKQDLTGRKEFLMDFNFTKNDLDT